MTSEMLLASKYLGIINQRGQRSLPLKRVCRNNKLSHLRRQWRGRKQKPK